MILPAPPPENWKRSPRRPCITWLNPIQRDLRAYNLTLNEAVDLAQNPSSVAADVYVWRCAFLVVFIRKTEEEELVCDCVSSYKLLSALVVRLICCQLVI